MGMTWGCLNGDMPCPWEGSEAYASQMKDIEIAKMKERLATGRVVRPA